MTTELPPRLRTRTLEVTQCGLVRIALLACVAGSVFGAHPLALWSDNLPDFPGVGIVSQTLHTWDKLMWKFGPGRLYQTVHQEMQAFEQAGSSQPD